MGNEVPPEAEAEAFCTFAHNILKNGYRKCVFRYINIVRNKKMKVDIYVEFASIHHKLHKEGLFNLNVNWPHFKKCSI